MQFHICLGCVVKCADEMIFSPFDFPERGSQPPDHPPSRDPPAAKKKSFRFLFNTRIFIPFQDFYSIPGFLFPSRVFIPFQDFYSRVLRLKRNHSDFYCDMVSNLLQPCIDTFFRNINSTNLNSNLILHSTMQLACSKMRLQWKRFFFSKCWTISSFILGFPLSWGW